MKFKAFWLAKLLAIVCILAVGSVSMVYADSHEEGEEMEMEEESGISGWFRTDTDSLGTQIWVGASHPMGSVSIDSDIYVVGSFAEFDLGLGIPVADSDSLSLTFLPMVGIGFDYESANGPSSIIAPQLFTYLTAGSINFESWIQLFFNTPFDYDDDIFYTRNFLLYSLSDTIAIGPQIEAGLILKGLEEDTETGLDSLVVGGRINLGYGENNTLGLFVGFETQLEDDSEDTGLTGRMTFFRSW
jgi:hypothetical protein